MIKRLVSLRIVAVLFVIASCVPATTPQNRYATEMLPALTLLEKWQDDFTNIETLLTEPLDPTTGITRLQLIELYNLAMEYQISREDYSSLGLMSLDALVGPSANLSRDGQSILDILSEVTPVEEIQADHQVILECLQTRIAFADELASSIKKLSAIDMSKAGDLDACDPFDESLEKLTVFVDEER